MDVLSLWQNANMTNIMIDITVKRAFVAFFLLCGFRSGSLSAVMRESVINGQSYEHSLSKELN